MNINQTLANEFKIKLSQVDATVALIDDGNTIPFIARYRKEATGSLDDQLLRELHERLGYLRNLDEQRAKVTASLEEQGVITPELRAALDAAVTLTDIEDIYRPYRPKRRTRATMAVERGLQPLAEAILAQPRQGEAALRLAEQYIDEQKGVSTAQQALEGAQDIIAQTVSDDAGIRRRIRNLTMMNGMLLSRAADPEKLSVYELYAEFKQPLSKAAGHQILAINRGESEGFLKASVSFDRARAVGVICGEYVKQDSVYADVVAAACEDGYDRLIAPSVERELRSQLTERAAAAAIKVFSQNLRQLLMQPPVKNMVCLGLDPGYRTGCKVAVVDGTGRVLDTAVIYPVPPHNKVEAAKRTVGELVKRHGVQVFAIGNGTASHETEVFAAELIRELGGDIKYMVVSEAGASVYSASKLAAKEFPDFDVSLRSAVSIARRLQDPLAELVKIDPKAIGVGQYQHDMPQAELSAALDGVVEDCVNSVGVDLNTASAPLLARIAGISATVAGNIVEYREQNGAFSERSQLKKVAKLGPKAYEQCAGFLRVSDGKNPLDGTAVHPESYSAALGLLSRCGYSEHDINSEQIKSLRGRIDEYGAPRLAQELGIGEPTLLDIAAELIKPARDPRDELPEPMLRSDVMSMEDLSSGMQLKGTVRNVIDFGAFVDVGVHQDGLVHISQITDRFIKHPSELLKVGDIVDVWVLSVDVKKQRISLSMKKPKQEDKND